MKTHRLSAASRCTRCLIRWRQSKLGLCRKCEHEVGIAAVGNMERDAERLEKQRAKERTANQFRLVVDGSGRKPFKLELTPGLTTHARRDTDYVVVWAGSMDGALAMGLPLAADRGRAFDMREQWFPGQRKGAKLRHAGAFEKA